MSLLVQEVEMVLQRQLSMRELAILKAYATKPASQVAREFEILEQSVRETMKRVYFKLGVTSKAEAIKKAKEFGIL